MAKKEQVPAPAPAIDAVEQVSQEEVPTASLFPSPATMESLAFEKQILIEDSLSAEKEKPPVALVRSPIEKTNDAKTATLHINEGEDLEAAMALAKEELTGYAFHSHSRNEDGSETVEYVLSQPNESDSKKRLI